MKTTQIVIVCLMALATTTFGITKTWDGGSSGQWWVNWNYTDDQAPATSGDNLVFQDAAATMRTSMTAANAFKSVTFNDNVGSDIALTGNFTLTPAAAGDTTWTISAGAADIDCSGILTISSNQVFEIGVGRTLSFVPSGYVQDGNLFTRRLTKAGAGTLSFVFYQNRIAGLDVEGGTVKITKRDHFGCDHDGSPNPTWDASTTTLSGGGGIVAADDGVDQLVDISVAPKNIILGSGGGKLGADTGVTFKIGQNATQISGANDLTIIGAGTVQLVNANSFSGALSIESGTLDIDHASAVGSATSIIIAAGATTDVSGVTFAVGSSQSLGGAGTVVGDVSLAGGFTPGPGMSIEGDLTLAGTSTTTIDVTGVNVGEFDSITGTAGAREITCGGTLNINVDEASPVGTVQLIDFDTISGGFSSINIDTGRHAVTFSESTGILKILGAGTLFMVK